MGLNLCLTYLVGDMARRRALDLVEHGPPDRDQDTCGNSKFYNGRDAIWRGASRPLDHDPRSKNQAFFLTLIREMIWALHPRSNDRDISENGPSWTIIITVDRFDRTVTNFRPIKRHVLHVLKHPSLRFNPIDCQDTSLSRFS